MFESGDVLWEGEGGTGRGGGGRLKMIGTESERMFFWYYNLYVQRPGA